MNWIVNFHEDFDREFEAFPEEVQDSIYIKVRLLEKIGPQLSRPHADTLEGSKHANMKELRCNALDGVWRIAFAFDPERDAILLAAGDKSGVKEKRFYKRLIERADARFDAHLAQLERSK